MNCKVWIIAPNYPTRTQPQLGTFVRSLARAWVKAGHAVTVIAPQPWFRRSTRQLAFGGEDPAAPGEPRVLRPGYMTWSSVRLGPISSLRWTTRTFAAAASRASDGLERPDAIYAQFLFPAGFVGRELAARLDVPLVADLGEHGFEHYECKIGEPWLRSVGGSLAAAVCVSPENARYARERLRAPGPVELVPNGIDPELFHPRDRTQARARLGLPREPASIVGFVGGFTHRKGPGRVLEAIRGIEGAAGIFIGGGPQAVRGAGVLLADRVPHEAVPHWLAAADVFCMPTLVEGCSNAVIEAMACGLPVVSSDIPAVRESVGPEAGILVDPLDVGAIRSALEQLLGDPARRRAMGAAGAARAARFTLAQRAEKIMRLVESAIARRLRPA